MRIVVCVKQVPDPEIPPARFKIDPEAKKVIPPYDVPSVMGSYDARACEFACRLKDQDKAGTKITAISLGQGNIGYTVKYAISMGADDGIVLQDPSFEDSDSFGVAHILSKAIQRLGDYDLVLCGRQSSDWEAGQTGALLAETLGLPLVTVAGDIKVAGGMARVRRPLRDGFEEMEVRLPCVVTVSGDVGLPRLPRALDIVRASRQSIPVWTAADLGTDPSLVGPAAAHTETLRLFIPVREVQCEMIGGDTPREAAANLLASLKRAGAL